MDSLNNADAIYQESSNKINQIVFSDVVQKAIEQVNNIFIFFN